MSFKPFDFASSAESQQDFSTGDGQQEPQEQKGFKPFSFATDSARQETKNLPSMLDLKNDLTAKLEFVRDRNKAADAYDIGEGVTVGDALKSVQSTAFNTTDPQSMKHFIGAIEDAYKKTSGDRYALGGVATDAFKRGYVQAGAGLARAGIALKPGAATQQDEDMLASLDQAEASYATRFAPRAVGSMKDVASANGGLNKASALLKFAVESIAENLPRQVAGTGLAIAGGIVGGVPGAMAGAAIGGFGGNLGEAVGDQTGEGLKLNKTLAIAQGTGYSLIDSLFSVEKMAGGIISGVFKKSLVEGARKEFIGTAGKALLVAAKAGGEEALNEPLQSQVVGRARRYAQTGTALAKKADGSMETTEDVVWATVDESMGGFMSGLGLGGASSGAKYLRDSSTARRAQANGFVQAISDDAQGLDQFDHVAILQAANAEATLSHLGTDGVTDGLNAETVSGIKEAANKALENAVSGMSDNAKIAWQAAKDKVTSDFQWSAVDKSQTSRFNLGNVTKSMADSGEGYKLGFDSDSGIGLAVGDDKRIVVMNMNGLRMPEGVNNVFDNITDAAVFARELDLFNTQRMSALQPKFAMLTKFMKAASPGADAVIVDTPAQLPSHVKRAYAKTVAEGNPGLAMYDPGNGAGTDKIYIVHDNIKSVGDAIVNIFHESIHSELFDMSRNGELNAFRYGDVKTEESFVSAFEASINDPTKAEAIKGVVSKAVNRVLSKAGLSVRVNQEDVARSFFNTVRGRMKQGDGGTVEAPSATSRANPVAASDKTIDSFVSAHRDKLSEEQRLSMIEEQDAMNDISDPQSAGDEGTSYTGDQKHVVVPTPEAVALKLERRKNLTAADIDVLEQNGVHGRDLFDYGYLRLKGTNAWRFVGKPAVNATVQNREDKTNLRTAMPAQGNSTPAVGNGGGTQAQPTQDQGDKKTEQDRKETRKQALRELAEASGDEIWKNGVANGDFAGDGELNIDDDGNVLLTRHADNFGGLTKNGSTMTREELRNVALGGGSYGGSSVNTSAMTGWEKKSWAAAEMTAGEEGKYTGVFKIPKSVLEQMLRDGDAALAGINHGEIILRPEVAEKWLFSVNGMPVSPQASKAQEAITEATGAQADKTGTTGVHEPTKQAHGTEQQTAPVLNSTVDSAKKTEENYLLPEEYPVTETPVEEIKLSEDVPNFKEGADDKTGETEPIRAESYKRLGTPAIVVWERLNGNKEVITGRHRLALARRTGEKTIPTQIVKEADGFTKEMALTLDAESNIRDGQGSVKDYANYIRERKINKQQASGSGILGRDKGRQGYAIGAYAEADLYSAFRDDKVGPAKAAAIAELAPNNAPAQQLGMKYATGHTAQEVSQYMRTVISMRNERESSGQQLDLLGFDTSWQEEAEKQATAASRIVRSMQEELAALKNARSLSKEQRQKVVSKYGVRVGDTASIEKRIAELGLELDRWENWHLNPDLVDVVKREAGTKKDFALESTTKAQIDAEAKKREDKAEIDRRQNATISDNSTATELDAPQLDLGGDAAPTDLFGAANVVKQEQKPAPKQEPSAASKPIRTDVKTIDELNMDYRQVLSEQIRSLFPTQERVERTFGRGLWKGYVKRAIEGNDVLRGFSKFRRAGGNTAWVKPALAKAASLADLKAIAEKLDASIAKEISAPATANVPRTDVKSPIDNVSDEKKARAAELIARMTKRANRMSAGLDPESLIDGIELASIYIEGGVKTFAQFAQSIKEASEELYGKIKDHLITIWTGAQATNPEIEELTRSQAKSIIERIDAESSTPKSNVSQAAELMVQALKTGQLTRLQASKIMADVYGGTDAEGKYSSKDTTDVAELAVNMIIRDSKDYPTNVTAEKAVQVVNELKELISRMPTQTTRTAEMDKMQQFSTPPPLAYVVNWVANIKKTDTVIEPSAGIGGIAVFAHNAGARVITNELSDRRAAILKELDISDASFSVNAEILNALLDPKVRRGEIPRPSVVVMNPPFSNSANTDKSNTAIGGKHIEEALSLLEDGGRLVAIVGEGMAADKSRLAGWWKKVGQTYSVRANIGVNGEEYRKYGTTFNNQIIVIDKTGPTKEGSTIVGNVESIEELPILLKEVQNERANVEQSSSEPGGASSAEGAGAGNPQGSGLSPATGGLQSGRTGQGASATRRSSKNGNGQPSVQKPGRSTQGGKKDGTVSDTERGSVDAAGRDSGTDSVPTVEGLELKTKQQEAKIVAEDEVFTSYSPSKAIVEGSKKHPTPLVESSAMASVDAPDVSYSPKLPKNVITDGILSDAQIETVVYAGQAHQSILPDGSRMGYFIGDGTGVGKGREIAGIITDNLNNGRKKAVWVSKKAELINDAERDLTALGVKVPLIDMSKNGGNALVGAGNGVAFIPYTSLARDNPGVAPDSNQLKAVKGGAEKKSRIERLRDWLGADFDGVIAFDEVHLAGNAIDIKGKRGVKKASKNGMAVVDLQKIFPKARVVYVSATGATEISNLAYGDRLGIWGPGTPFSNKQSFFNKISAGGMSSMEIVARDLKAMGRYIARTLSFKGVDNEQITHTLTEDQKRKYDEASKAWQMVFQNIDETMARTGANNNGKARGSALSKFYGAQQRFYNQLLTSLQMPSVILDAKKSLANGQSVVFQIVNTNEAALGRELTSSAEEEDFDPNDIDLSPMSVLLQYVESCYPTALYRETQDDNGNTKWEVVTDGEGNIVQDPQAVSERDSLIDRLSRMRMPGNPLELILDTFGVDNVAEVTGRSQRVVQKPDASGQMTTQIEKGRSSRHAIADTKDFNSGKKRVLVFSDAGGTGFSYHAGSNFKNQQRRIHYLIQAGWRADAALQGFGRTHRSDQVSAPFYKLVSTDIKGHKRFISTIARRLSQLGSLTSGDRSAAGSGVLGNEDNLENDYAQDSLDSLFIAIFQGNVSGFTLNSLAKKMGFSKTIVDSKTGDKKTVNTLIDPETGSLNDTKLPTVPQFLNRILMLEVDEQNRLFDEFMNRMTTRIENAKLDGSYDPGLQTLKAVEIRKVAEDVVYEQQGTSAKTKIIDVDVDHKVIRIPFSKVQAMQGGMFVKNNKSGHVYALFHGPGRTEESGRVVETWRRIGPHNTDIIQKSDVQLWYNGNYTEINDETEARLIWDKQYDNSPKVRTERQSYIAGAFLPVWDRIGIERPQIWRVTPKGEGSFLGARIPSKMVADVRRKMGAGKGVKLSADNVFSSILDGGQSYDLANGWMLKRSLVLGERRIEVVGIEEDSQIREFVNFIGGFSEKIGWTTRCFIPTEIDQGVKSLEKLLKKSPVIDDSDTSSDQVDATRFRRAVTPDQDRAYMDAVKRGDMDAAQKMVDAAAKLAGYTIGPVWHGTDGGGFTLFKPAKDGVFTTQNRASAEAYGQRVIKGFLKSNNMITLTPDVLSDLDNEIGGFTEEDYRNNFASFYDSSNGFMRKRIVELIRSNGYDGYIIPNDVHWTNKPESDVADAIVVFNAEQIKSADPVTRDDAGNVIPLSQRFDDGLQDIRFRRGGASSSTGNAYDGNAGSESDVSIVPDDNSIASRYVRALPSTDPEARRRLSVIEQAYDVAYSERKLSDIEDGARVEYAKDVTAAELSLLSGQGLSGDTEQDATRMARDKIAVDGMMRKAIDTKATSADVQTAILAGWQWFKRGSEAAVALRLRFDPVNTPEGRRSMLMRMVFSPSAKDVAAIESMGNVRQRAEALAPRAKMAVALLKHLERNGVNIQNISASDLMDNEKLSAIIRLIETHYSTKGDKIHEYWRNAILSGPTTQIVNIIGNVTNASIEAFVQRPVEAIFNSLAGNKDAATFRSIKAMYKAIIPSIKAANKNFAKAFETENGIVGPAVSPFDERNVAIGGKTGRVVRVPQRGMLATDEWFKTIFMAMNVADFATRQFDGLVNSGVVKESDRDAFMSASMDQRSVAFKQAWKETLSWSFQQEPGTLAKGILHWRNDPMLGFWLKFIFPFVKTPANIISTGIRKSPIGTLNYIRNVAAGKYSSGEALKFGAEQAVMFAVLSSLYFLLKGDDDDDMNRPRITGSRKSTAFSSKGEREAEYRNFPPMSIRIGDKWYSYSRVEPLATMVSTSVDLISAAEDAYDGRVNDAASTLFGSLINNIRDKTFLTGVSNLLGLVEGDKTKSEALIEGTIAGFMPNIARTAMRSTDEYVRDMRNRGTGEAWFVRSAEKVLQMAVPLPGIASPKRVDSFGDPVKREGGFLFNFLIPFRMQDAEKINKIDSMLKRYNDSVDRDARWYPTAPDIHTYKFGRDEVRMNDAEYERYQMLAGEIATRHLDGLKFKYENPDEREINRVKDVFKNAREIARNKMKPDVFKRWKSGE